MTDEDAIAIIDNPDLEAQCLTFLRASVQAEKAIIRDVGGDKANHEAHPMMLSALLVSEVIFLNSHWWKEDWPEDARETTSLCVNCSDVFAYACADAEALKYDEIEDLFDHWQRDPLWGPAVWCIKKRKQYPQKRVADAIRKTGLWDLDNMDLADNTQNAEVQACLARASHNTSE